MKEQVLNNIREYNLIENGDNVVIGLSGGPDSMALLYVLLEIEEIDFNIHIAHVNHGVRGKEALADEIFVEKLAKKLNLPYYSIQVNMNQYAKDKGISSEEAGRKLRYGFFHEILRKIGGGKIAVAHNKNDQAETLLMRIFRGTGIDGLRGMDFISEDIIRPILNIHRAEIEKYLDDRNIETRLDKTNLEPIYNRNKVRLELIPYIEENFNPNIINTLWRTSRIATIDSDFLEKYTEKSYNNMMKKKGKHSIILNREDFLKEEQSIQQRIIRNSIIDINGSIQGITERHIISILELFIEGNTGKSINLVDNLIARTNYEEIIIEKKRDLEKKDYLYEIPIDDIIYIEALGLKITTEVIPANNIDYNNIDNFTKYFDFEKINGKLYIRNRKAGDRFTPYGMIGSKKIKDYFIDEKVSKDKRDEIPILIDKNNIIWVIGYRISDLYKITEGTKKVLRISFENI
ncbi:MAG: tRNA lysidine(34) synthetase TilS [Tissierellia bacterium]|nr:tRNA lysidine(34) synthetase TilS [Tissierellia bacterium]